MTQVIVFLILLWAVIVGFMVWSHYVEKSKTPEQERAETQKAVDRIRAEKLKPKKYSPLTLLLIVLTIIIAGLLLNLPAGNPDCETEWSSVGDGC